MEKRDVTHLVSQIIIGSSLDIFVEYELSSQENRSEIEGVLSSALNIASSQLSASGVRLSQINYNIRNENLRISIKGPIKTNIFLANVSKMNIL